MGIPTYKITVLKLAEAKIDKSMITYGVGLGTVMNIPYLGFLVRGNGHVIVVDTGCHSADWVSSHILPCTQSEDEKITKVIEKAAGLKPADVDIVINTHLHFDHCGNNREFHNARFYVQEREWHHAHHPVENQAAFYRDTSFCFDPPGVDYFTWVFLNGDAEILPGIKVLFTPGHTPGCQTVLVKTDEGTVALTGDTFNVMENLRNRIPGGITSDVGEWFASVDKIRAVADRVICGHDTALVPFQSQDFPKLD